MLAYPIAAAALVVVVASGADASTPKQKMEFMRSMKAATKKSNRSRKLKATTTKEYKEALYGNSKESSAMRKKFVSKAKVVTPDSRRKLDQNEASNGWEYYNNNKQNNYYNTQRDGSDDYFAATGEWNNGFGFDPSQFSLSYHRCASVRQFDDDLAAEEDTTSVFATKHFAVFRFCPESTCMGVNEQDGYAEFLAAQEEWEAKQAAQYQNEQNDGEYWDGQYRNAEFLNGKWMTRDGGVCKENDFDATGECKNPIYAGARGEGCQSNYGEYMIELEDYLQLMLEYQEERVQTYLTYCEECMFQVYQVWLQNGGQDNRKLTYEEFKSSDKHQKAARELGGNINGGLANQKYYDVCPEYDTCAEYQIFGGMDESYTEYFECTEIERNNGQVAYISPHCAENGFTVTLGLYADEYCNEYIGNGADISNYLGETWNVEEDALKMWYNSANGAMDILEFSNEEEVCIPCRKSDNPYLDSEYEAQTDDAQEREYNNYDDELNEICENLYMVSARCDKNYRSYSTKSKQAKYAEAVAQEDLACDFIDSVVMGNYDEMGFVNLGDEYQMESSSSGLFKDNMYAQQYGHYVSEVTLLQIFGLLASIAACAILALWSMSLHSSLSKRGPWRPRRGLNNAEAPPAEVSRQNSGIVMGRSQSNTSYYMT